MRRPSPATLLSGLALVALFAVLTTATALAQEPTTTVPTTPQHDGADHTAAIVLLVIVGVLLLAGGTAWAAARWWAYEPPWLVRARHASAEAAWRTSATWAEFRDWVRLGR
jgi:hypothetical protein